MANNVKVNLKNVRCAFLNIWKKAEPKFEGQAPAYRACFILDKDDPQCQVLEDAAFECAVEALGSEAAANKWMDRNYAQIAFKECAVCDGDERDEPTPEFENTIYISAKNSKVQPLIMTDAGEKQKEDGVTVDGFDIEGNQVYSGCMVNASIEFWFYNSPKGKGLSATLKGIKFVEDNEAFGGGGGSTASEDDLGGGESSSHGRSKSSTKDRRSARGSDNDDDGRSTRRRASRDEDEDEEEERNSRRSSRRRSARDDEDEEDDRKSRRSSRRDSEDDEDEDEGRSTRRRRR
ncbi:MAG: hypothetical protein [Bacteriophage sp.]|nr:MAG: hypothetical protein [Bacteriophage sp.]